MVPKTLLTFHFVGNDGVKRMFQITEMNGLRQFDVSKQTNNIGRHGYKTYEVEKQTTIEEQAKFLQSIINLFEAK